MSEKRIYVVKQTFSQGPFGEEPDEDGFHRTRLVSATSRNAAMNYVAKETLEVDLASQAECIVYASKGVKLEEA